MTWFKIDDRFHSHPKAIAAGNAACGLWSRCGSWASDHATNGFIPRAIAHVFGTKQQIGRLLSTGLWTKVENGYQMHDYLDFNPTAEQVKHSREKARQRQQSRRDSLRDSPRDSRSDTGVTHATPSRPVPSRPEGSYIGTQLSVVPTVPETDDDDLFTKTVELIVDAKERQWNPQHPKPWRAKVRTATIAEDGELIRRMLADGDEPEVAALFVLGHTEAQQRRDARNGEPSPLCPPDCPDCDMGWIDTGEGLAPCPRRTA